MPNRFRNKYRITSTRLQNWDYGWAGAYFVTICTKDRTCSLGQVVDGKVHLSPTGTIADILWHEIVNHASHVRLDAFVVMPNHVHGIIILKKDGPSAISRGSLPKGETIGQRRFQNQGANTLSSIVGSYKSAVTKHARRLGFEHAWQANYWENIIRDEQALQNIRNYIVNNPKNWDEDRFNEMNGR